jgi:predicted enzyme related to lactoylglutathione lyase
MTHLGVGAPEGVFLWDQQAGPTVFSPFKADTDYFAADKTCRLNLRVDDLDGMLASLGAAGVEVITKAEWDATPEIGRFARIHDPEGNAIELWRPPAA